MILILSSAVMALSFCIPSIVLSRKSLISILLSILSELRGLKGTRISRRWKTKKKAELILGRKASRINIKRSSVLSIVDNTVFDLLRIPSNEQLHKRKTSAAILIIRLFHEGPKRQRQTGTVTRPSSIA